MFEHCVYTKVIIFNLEINLNVENDVFQLSYISKDKKARFRKEKHLFNEIRACVDTYENIFVFCVSDMRNAKMRNVRNQWKHSRFFIGKNKVMALALGRYLEEEYQPNLHKVGQMLRGQCGLLFSNQSVEEVLGWFRSYSEADFARSGHVATEGVILKEGPLPHFPHSLEPELRRLGLPTTLTKGIIHLVKDHEVCKVGDVLTPEAAKILQHLGYQMAEFHIIIQSAWSKDGSFLKLQTEVSDVTCNENAKKKKQKKSGSKKSLDNLERAIDILMCEDMEVIENGASSFEVSEIDKENIKNAKSEKSGPKKSLDSLESEIDVPMYEDMEVIENGDASLEAAEITALSEADEDKSIRLSPVEMNNSKENEMLSPMPDELCKKNEKGSKAEDNKEEGSEIDKENMKKAKNEKSGSKKSLDNLESEIVPMREDMKIMENCDASLEAVQQNTAVSEADKNKSIRLSPVVMRNSKERKMSPMSEDLSKKSDKGSKAEDTKEEGSEIDKELSSEVRDVNYANLENHGSTPKHCSEIKTPELAVPLNEAEDLEVLNKVKQSYMICSAKKIVHEEAVLNSDDGTSIRQSQPCEQKIPEEAESGKQVDIVNSSQDSPLFRELRNRSIKVHRKKNAVEVIENGAASSEVSEIDKENIKNAKSDSKKSLDNLESEIDVPMHEGMEVIESTDASLEAAQTTTVSEADKNKSIRLSSFVISNSKEKEMLSPLPKEQSREEGSKVEDNNKEEDSEIDKELCNEVKDINYASLKNYSSTPKPCNEIKHEELAFPLNEAEDLAVSDKVKQPNMICSAKKIVQEDILNSDDGESTRQSRPRKRKVAEETEISKQVDTANSSQDSPLFRELRNRSVKVSCKKKAK